MRILPASQRSSEANFVRRVGARLKWQLQGHGILSDDLHHPQDFFRYNVRHIVMFVVADTLRGIDNVTARRRHRCAKVGLRGYTKGAVLSEIITVGLDPLADRRMRSNRR
jgi:hypothetical protein